MTTMVFFKDDLNSKPFETLMVENTHLPLKGEFVHLKEGVFEVKFSCTKYKEDEHGNSHAEVTIYVRLATKSWSL